MSIELGTGDLVQVDAANIVALARVRSIDGDRLHVALEHGAFIPWIEETIMLRRFGDAAAHSWEARIIHSGSSTATFEVIGRTPAAPPSFPDEPDTEPDLDPLG